MFNLFNTMTYCFLWASRFHLFNSFICDCFSISFVCLVSSSRLVSSSSCLLSSSPLFISSPHLVSSPRLLISSPLLTSSPHLVSCPPLLVSSPRLGSSSVFVPDGFKRRYYKSLRKLAALSVGLSVSVSVCLWCVGLYGPWNSMSFYVFFM